MLAGRPAFQAGSLAKLYLGIMQEAPPRLDELRPGLPPELTRLVERLLAKTAEDRPNSANEVARVLAPFTDREASVVTAADPRTSAPPAVDPVVAGAGS